MPFKPIFDHFSFYVNVNFTFKCSLYMLNDYYTNKRSWVPIQMCSNRLQKSISLNIYIATYLYVVWLLLTCLVKTRMKLKNHSPPLNSHFVLKTLNVFSQNFSGSLLYVYVVSNSSQFFYWETPAVLRPGQARTKQIWLHSGNGIQYSLFIF